MLDVRKAMTARAATAAEAMPPTASSSFTSYNEETIAPPPAPPPSVWRKVINEKSGDYFHNERTNETSWEKPEHFV